MNENDAPDSRNRIQVFAVLRMDKDAEEPELAVTVKEVVPTQEEAEREVERLNALRKDELSLYFWQPTRYFPAGGAPRR